MYNLDKFTYTSDDIITTDKYLAISKKSNFQDKITYIKTDVLYYNRQIEWRGEVHPKDINEFKKPNAIVGHSDYEINDSIIYRYPFNKWFVINSNSKAINVHPLPLGITNNTNESPDHPIFGDTEIMLEVFNTNYKKEHLAYLNVSPATHPERKEVIELFKDCNYVYKKNLVKTINDRRQFLIDIRKSKFVLCPRGNGIDTHRFWETLYMGSIPIVKRDILYESFTDLPILIVDDWKELTAEYLENKYSEITSKEWNYDKLKISYWEKYIEDKMKK